MEGCRETSDETRHTRGGTGRRFFCDASVLVFVARAGGVPPRVRRRGVQRLVRLRAEHVAHDALERLRGGVSRPAAQQVVIPVRLEHLAGHRVVQVANLVEREPQKPRAERDDAARGRAHDQVEALAHAPRARGAHDARQHHDRRQTTDAAAVQAQRVDPRELRLVLVHDPVAVGGDRDAVRVDGLLPPLEQVGLRVARALFHHVAGLVDDYVGADPVEDVEILLPAVCGGPAEVGVERDAVLALLGDDLEAAAVERRHPLDLLQGLLDLQAGGVLDAVVVAAVKWICGRLTLLRIG